MQRMANHVSSETKSGQPCPCCHHLTFSERGGFEICPVCFWEDDGQDEEDAAVVRGGPNGNMSLSQWRANYRALGASDLRARQHVRRPYAHELP
ncbi:CPCC family cysteine-rich protein [Variovorax sp. YR216]|uniref:CPCC family cysteine-rich protein n=1 Tax=Variovorax sp. YR216 TaxID=1882828 RepID=UPI000B885B69